MASIKVFWKKYKYALIVLIQGGIFYLLFKQTIFIYFALAISILCFISPKILNALTQFEEYIAKNIARFINFILLSIVYFLFVLPIGILKRITKKEKSQTLEIKDHKFNIKDFNNPW